MVIGERLRQLREAKNLSQGDIESRCGLLRCYLSRVENGHTVPSVETLETLARAMELPMYQLFYEGDKPTNALKLPNGRDRDDAWGSSGKSAEMLNAFRRILSLTNDRDRKILLLMARKMAQLKR